MKMICDVPDKVIKCIKDGTWCGSSVAEKMIANGIPLSSSEKPCEDAISREAVIDSIHANCVYENEYNLTAKHIEDAVKQLPPVNPQKPNINEVLAKIRAEIADARFIDKDTKHCKNANATGLEVAMNIIDKFMAEGSDKE